MKQVLEIFLDSVKLIAHARYITVILADSQIKAVKVESSIQLTYRAPSFAPTDKT